MKRPFRHSGASPPDTFMMSNGCRCSRPFHDGRDQGLPHPGVSPAHQKDIDKISLNN
jgi:hypothetical protein